MCVCERDRERKRECQRHRDTERDRRRNSERKREISFQDFFSGIGSHSCGAWQVQNLMGEAGRLKTQERVAVQVRRQSACRILLLKLSLSLFS